MSPNVTPEQAEVLRALVATQEGKLCERCQCCEMFRQQCENCGGYGHSEFGELHDFDPLWYDEDDIEWCATCEGYGGWWRCDCNEQGEHTPAEAASEEGRG